jgi:flagellar hook-associated protein FlgK
LAAGVQLVSGSLSGNGTIGGPFANVGGTVRPGGAGVVGGLSFLSVFTQGDMGTLEIDLASDVSFDRINVPSNDTLLSGTIVVSLLGGYTPADGTTWAFDPPPGGGSLLTDVHVIPSTFTAHSISMGAELDFHAPGNATTTTSAPATSTTTTTAGAAATTTTSTTAPASTPTTTTSHASTTQPAVTTTTVPGSCDGPSAATFASIDCRLDALIAQLTATPDVPAKLKDALAKNLQKARDKKQQAEHATSITRAVLGELKQARRQMITFSHHIRSLAGRRAIHGDTGPALASAGDAISADLKTLRNSLRSAGKGKVRATNP